jgi:hypothetical protein
MITSTSPALFAQMQRFLRWWLQELADLAHLVPIGRQKKRRSLIYLEADRVIIERADGELVERYEEQTPFHSLAPAERSELIELTAGGARTILLPPSEVYFTSLSLPPAARSKVDNAVELQLAMISPIRPDLVSWAITEIRRESERVNVDVALARRAMLESIHQIATELEYGAWAIAPAHAPDHPFAGYSARKRSPAGSKALRFATLFAMTLLGASLFTIAGGSYLASRADARTEELQPEAAGARAASRAALRQEEQRRAISPLFGEPDSAAILNELADNIPGSDWLRMIDRRQDGSVNFTVSTANETMLDEALRQSDVLRGLHVIDQTAGSDGRVEVTYETDAL